MDGKPKRVEDSSVPVVRMYHYAPELFSVSGLCCSGPCAVTQFQPHPAWIGAIPHPFINRFEPWMDVCSVSASVQRLEDRVVSKGPAPPPDQKKKARILGVESLAWTPSGDSLLTLHENGNCGTWTACGMHYGGVETALGRDATGLCMTMLNESEFLCGASDGSIRISTSKATVEGCLVENAHEGPVTAVTRSPDVMFVSGGADGKLRFADFRFMLEKPVALVDCGPACARVYSLDWNPASSLVLSASEDGIVRLWDARTASICASLIPPDPKAAFSSSASSSAATGPQAGGIEGGVNVTRPAVRCVRWNGNGVTFAYGGDDCRVYIGDTRRMGDNVAVLPQGAEQINSIAWHPFHERMLVAGTDKGNLFHWLVGYREPVGKITAGNNPVKGVAYHPSGHLLAAITEKPDMAIRFFVRPVPGKGS